MLQADCFKNAPFVIYLLAGDVILARRLDDVDRSLEEDAIADLGFEHPTDIIINNEFIVHSNDIDYIIRPMDQVVGAQDEVDVYGMYIGIDPTMGDFIIQDTSGVEHNVDAMHFDVVVEDESTLKKLLQRMRKVIDSMKEVKEITPELKDNLEGNLEEIYAELDRGIEDE